MMEISFETTTTEKIAIEQIAKRAVGIANKADVWVKRIDFMMDITAAHANGCRLNLDGLLHAPEFDFTHDVFGIHRHIDRSTGKLGGCFVPRYAA